LAWTIEYDEGAVRDLKKLDRQVQREILDYMEKRIGRAEDPRAFGKPLRHSKFGLWRYRVRNYRIVCQLRQAKLIVLVVAVGHRSRVYEDLCFPMVRGIKFPVGGKKTASAKRPHAFVPAAYRRQAKPESMGHPPTARLAP